MNVKRVAKPASISGVVLVLAIGAGVRAGEIVIDLGRGPLTVHIPSSYQPEDPAPLVLSLHGWGLSAAVQEIRMPLLGHVEEYGFLYVLPEGTIDCTNKKFWNATDACCDFEGTGVDDSGYLLAVIDEIKAQLSVDDRRVYVVGHSNGGFMSHRMACDHADTVAAIASLAGVTYLDPSDCTPSGPVHVLQIHGTADHLVPYEGGCLTFGGCYIPATYCAPGAVQTVETWATYNGCSLDVETGPSLDLVANLPGSETTVTRYVTGCEPGGSAELWTIQGGSHIPAFTAESTRPIIEFLLAHPKPPECADTDDSGAVDEVDLVNVALDWGTDGSANGGDVDGSGIVDVADVVAVILEWGPCP